MQNARSSGPTSYLWLELQVTTTKENMYRNLLCIKEC